MEYRKIDKIISYILIFITVPFIISLSILPPLISRSFYYNQIDSLGIAQNTGYTKEEIIEAYDDVMDFIWLHKEFKTGSLEYSEDGKSHFEDCVPLFWLDLIGAIVTSSLMLIVLILVLTKMIKIYRPKGYSPLFFGAIITISFIVVIGIIGIIDFDLLFRIFHTVFFPGKDNWLFNPYTDPVILILPLEFFMNCGIFIGVNFTVLSLIMIGYGIYTNRKLIQK